MRNVVETEVEVPQKQLAELLADPANNQKWMVGLESYKPIDKNPGQVGAKYELTFVAGGRKTVLVAETVKRNLPDEVGLSMDNPTVHLDATAKFVALSPTKTKYISDQTFNFKGFVGKLFGIIGAGSIKKQQERDMHGFKDFAEKVYNSGKK